MLIFCKRVGGTATFLFQHLVALYFTSATSHQTPLSSSKGHAFRAATPCDSAGKNSNSSPVSPLKTTSAGTPDRRPPNPNLSASEPAQTPNSFFNLSASSPKGTDSIFIALDRCIAVSLDRSDGTYINSMSFPESLAACRNCKSEGSKEVHMGHQPALIESENKNHEKRMDRRILNL